MRNIAEDRTAGLTAAARLVTWAGSAFVLVPLAVICCLVFLRAGLRREAFAIAISLAGAMLISDAVKLLVSRPRPPVEHLQAVTGSSFPSGHSTQAGAFWLSLVLALRAPRVPPRLTRVAAGLALVLIPAVALSRVYLGVHYPADVIAGVLLGDRLGGVRCALRAGEHDQMTTSGRARARGQHPASRPPPDETLCPCALGWAGRSARCHHASRKLFPALACHRGRACRVRRPAGTESGRSRHHRDRDRSGRGQRPRQAARAPAPPPALTAHAHPHAALDIIPIRPQRRRLRVCHRRLHRAAGPCAGPCSSGRHRRLLARAHRRSLPKRRRRRCRDRDRLWPSRQAPVTIGSQATTRRVQAGNARRMSGAAPTAAERWMPGVRVARTYQRSWLRADLVAGAVLAAILVPQGMAYAELAGLPAVTGLYTTVACLVGYAVFGPSRVLVLGPDSSISPLILAAITPLLVIGGDPATRNCAGRHAGHPGGTHRDRPWTRQARIRRRPPVKGGAGRIHERPCDHDHRRPAAEAFRLLHARRFVPRGAARVR